MDFKTKTFRMLVSNKLVTLQKCIRILRPLNKDMAAGLRCTERAVTVTTSARFHTRQHQGRPLRQQLSFRKLAMFKFETVGTWFSQVQCTIQ